MTPSLPVVNAALEVRAWVRHVTHMRSAPPTADDLWTRIRARHPRLSDRDKTYVYEQAEPAMRKARVAT